MNNQLTKRQRRYERNILGSLNHISVLDPPSFSLFQALLTGVRILCFFLFHLLGTAIDEILTGL